MCKAIWTMKIVCAQIASKAYNVLTIVEMKEAKGVSKGGGARCESWDEVAEVFFFNQ